MFLSTHTLSAEYLDNQNETAQVFCQMGSGAVTWQRLNPTQPISMGTPKYGGSGNRLDVFNVVGSDEGQYQCLYTDSGTGQQTTDTACLFVPGQFSSVCVNMILMCPFVVLWYPWVVVNLS